MSRYDIIKREALRNCTCRGCDVTIPKGEVVIYTYSLRNRGQHIFFCLDCAKLIGKLSK